jgi:nucleotide-binding universal stress UspA family protein
MGTEAVESPRPVLVGVDGSRAASATVDLAVAEAARRGAPLRIVHVWPGRYVGVFRGRSEVPSTTDGRRLLDILSQRAALAEPGLPISTELLEGGAANVLTGCTTHARMLVVGHRDGVPALASWGSTAAYLAHHSACPLLVRRGVAGDGPVVVAASARTSGSMTLGYAFAQAAVLGTRLVAVHMWRRPDADGGSARAEAARACATERRAADDLLADALAEWCVRYPGVAVERLVVSELDMAYAIERASRRGRLLVAGIGRHGRFAELLYGSFTPGPASLRSATCPVVLVPAGRPVAGPSTSRLGT